MDQMVIRTGETDSPYHHTCRFHQKQPGGGPNMSGPPRYHRFITPSHNPHRISPSVVPYCLPQPLWNTQALESLGIHSSVNTAPQILWFENILHTVKSSCLTVICPTVIEGSHEWVRPYFGPQGQASHLTNIDDYLHNISSLHQLQVYVGLIWEARASRDMLPAKEQLVKMAFRKCEAKGILRAKVFFLSFFFCHTPQLGLRP